MLWEYLQTWPCMKRITLCSYSDSGGVGGLFFVWFGCGFLLWLGGWLAGVLFFFLYHLEQCSFVP